MNNLKSNTEDISLILIYESQQVDTMKCNNNSLMEDILKNYALHKKEELTSLIFIYEGEKIENLKQSFFLIMSEDDKKRREMNILIYNINKSKFKGKKQPNYINIIFRLESAIVIKKIRRDETLKNICNKYASENKYNFNALVFKYNGENIDLNKKFDDIANSYDKNCLGMTILVTKKKNPLMITFLKKNCSPYKIECYKEDKVSDIFSNYADNNSLNLKNLKFNYGIININLDNTTFDQLITNSDSMSHEKLDFNNTTMMDTITNDKMEIIVSDNTETSVSCCKKCKKLIIILISIIIIILIILVIIFFLIRKKPSNNDNDKPIQTNSDKTIEIDNDNTKDKNNETTLETDNDMTTEINSDTTIKTDSDIEKEINSDTTIKIDSDIATEINSDTTLETYSDIKTEITSDTTLETYSDIKTEITSDTILETDSDIKTEITSDIILETDSDLKTVIINSDTTLKTDSDMTTEMNSDIKTEIISDTTLETDNDIKTEMNSDTTLETDSDIKTEMNSDTTIKTEYDIKTEIKTDNDITTETNKDNIEPIICDTGYYLLENIDKTECVSCNSKIPNCIECNVENKILVCNKCQDGFQLLENLCIEKVCEIGKNEKCASCKTEKGRTIECNTCNEGYFISEEISTICSKCSINNCRKCSITNGKEICEKCLDTFLTITDENGIIKSCECDSGYSINNGICSKPGNWINMLMDVDLDWNGGLATILYNYYAKIKLNEIDVYINGTKSEVTVDNREIKYKFNKGGIYFLEINIKKVLTSMEWLFNCNAFYICSVSFLPGFDCSKVTSMEYMFVNSNIESIDMKYLDISNVKNLKFLIHENNNVKRYEKLNEYIIDLSSFDTSQVTNCLGMIHDISEDVIIKISNKFTKCREQISIANRVINTDEIECKRFENCETCNGSKETLKCSKCIIGYKLNKDSICIKQKCNAGEKEKCYDCKIEKENECLSCNEGYYLPLNSIDQTSCKKCQVEGCKSCNNIDGNCEQCKDYYEASMKNGKIIECNLICNLGEGNKCQTCNLESKNKCGSCNPGYKLMKDGICKKIENSFIASYNVTSINNPTYIMNLKGNNIKFSNIEMYINDIKVSPYLVNASAYKIYHRNCYVSYKFSNLGINKVKIVINQTLTKMQDLFYLCSNLVNITFSETFDTSNVKCMNYMFGSCNSLISVNLSSFNTSLVNSYEYMFQGSDKLTSLDLSNFEGEYSCYFSDIFGTIKNLKYIDISSLYSVDPKCNSLNLLGLPDNGTIIANSKLLDISAKNWKIIYKN